MNDLVGEARKQLDAIHAERTGRIVDVQDVPDTDDSDQRRFSLGLCNIDAGMKAIRPGELVVVGARQGHGKTALAETIAITNGLHHKVLVATLEMRVEDIRDRMIGRVLDLPLDDVERLRMHGDEQYRYGRDALAALSISFYRPNKPELRTSRAVLAAAERSGAAMLILDYTRSLTDWIPGDSRACSEIVNRISMWSKDTRIATVLLSQLNRDAQGRRPIESQLQDTGRLEQEAEKIILLYRKFAGDPLADNVAEVIVAKNRRGKTFRGHVRWYGSRTRFADMTREEEAAAPCCHERAA